MVKGASAGIENVGGDIDKVTGKRCFFMGAAVALAGWGWFALFVFWRSSILTRNSVLRLGNNYGIRRLDMIR